MRVFAEYVDITVTKKQAEGLEKEGYDVEYKEEKKGYYINFKEYIDYLISVTDTNDIKTLNRLNDDLA